MQRPFSQQNLRVLRESGACYLITALRVHHRHSSECYICTNAVSYPCRLITVHMYIIAMAENVFLHGCNILRRENEALVALSSLHISVPS